MQDIKKWNVKKKSLGFIPSEMGVQQKKSFKITLQKKSSKSRVSLSKEALQSTSTARRFQREANDRSESKSLGEVFFLEANNRYGEPQAPNPHISAQSIVGHNKAKSLLSVAIAEGGGTTDPKRNLRLSAAVKRAKEIGVPQATIQQIIRKSKLMTEARPVALMQIRYQRKVYIICTVLTRSQSEFQLQLMPTLKPHFAGFAPVLNMFNSLSYIEAIVPVDIGGDFKDLDKNVRRDACICGATDSMVKDYESGLFRFRVDPSIAADVAAGLLTKGYQIVNISYDFKPKRHVDLNSQEHEAYNNFLWKLRQIPEIDGIFDNVRNSVANKLEFNMK